MKHTYWVIVSASLVVGGTAALTGCNSVRGAGSSALPGATRGAATTAIPHAPGAGGSTDSAPAPDDRDQRYRQAILREVINNPKIGKLIPHKPVLGGTWRIGEAEDVHFLGSGRVALDYEDGHVAGRLVVHVVNPHDLTTWEVVRDESS
jgi:predicted small secreted protein